MSRDAASARVLVRVPNWLGDAVLALPALAGLRRHVSDAHLTLAGLKHAMRAALDAYRRDPRLKPAGGAPGVRTAEQFPAASRLKADACIHCHQVNNFRIEARRSATERDFDYFARNQ